MPLILDDKQTMHLEEVLSYLAHDEWKDFSGEADHIWLHVRALLIALGETEHWGADLHPKLGSLAYTRRHMKEYGPPQEVHQAA